MIQWKAHLSIIAVVSKFMWLQWTGWVTVGNGNGRINCKNKKT